MGSRISVHWLIPSFVVVVCTGTTPAQEVHENTPKFGGVQLAPEKTGASDTIPLGNDGGVAGVPPNDDCANATPIFDGQTAFSNVFASTDGPSAPSCPFMGGDPQINRDIWYNYQATCTGELQVSLCASNFDSKLAVYSGFSCPPSPIPLACNDDGCPPPNEFNSLVTLSVVQGQSYKIRVGAFGNFFGSGTISVMCERVFPQCSFAEGDCCKGHGGLGCDDHDCCGVVCLEDPFCCEVEWDSGCASDASDVCAICGGGNGEECVGCLPLQTAVAFFGTTVGSSGLDVSSCAIGDAADVWHCWTPQCGPLGRVNMCGSGYDTTLSVFDGCDGVELACDDDFCPPPSSSSSQVDFGVTPGQTYRIRVSGFNGDTGNYLLVATCPSCPNNNDCVCASSLLEGNRNFSNIGMTTDGPTLPSECNEGFGLFFNNDIWYDFTSPCTGMVTFSTCNQAIFDTRLALYAGCTCPVNNDRLIACNDDCAFGVTTSRLTANLVKGSCYKLRVGGFQDSTGSGTLTVQCDPVNPACTEQAGPCDKVHGSPGCNDLDCCDVVCDANPTCCSTEWSSSCVSAAASQCGPPSNVECETTPVETLPHTFTGDSTLGAHTCDDFEGNHVWVAFSIPSLSDVTLEFCDTDPLFELPWANLALGCPCTDVTPAGTSLTDCADGNARIRWNCLPAGTYYYPVISEPGSIGPYTIHVSAEPGMVCAMNDQCVDAAPLSDGMTPFSTIGALTDGPDLPAACMEGPNPLTLGQDVWFNYTASCTGTATFSTCSSADYDTRMALYLGASCPVTNGRLIACNDDALACTGFTSRITANVTAGLTYKLRLGGFGTAFGTGTLNVMCQGAAPTCPDGTFTWLDPPDGVVDARQPSSLEEGCSPLQGIRSLRVQAPPGTMLGCFQLCETANAGLGANAITNLVNNGDGTYNVNLLRAITPAAVTTVTYAGNGGVTGFFTSHPGNVNGDSQAGVLDILRIIDYLNGVELAPWGMYSTDVNFSGQFNPLDILREIDLLNGADCYDAMNGTMLPASEGICP